MSDNNFTEVTIKSETGPVAPPPADGRPENVPEQFWDAEKKAVKTDELLAAYAATTTTTEAPEEGSEEAQKDAAEGIAEGAGVDVKAVEAAFVETGEIPADVYEKMGAIGIDKATVDDFIQLRVAQADRVRTELLNGVGGEEAVTSMLDWAGKTWTDEQAAAFNDAASSGDRAKIELALAGLKTAYDRAHPSAPKRPALVTPQSTSSPAGGDTYGSMQELVRDQRSPEYQKDPGFRAKVAAKLARSNI